MDWLATILILLTYVCLLTRSDFRLPVTETLDGFCECSMWNPASKSTVLGKMYCSPNFICFASKVILEDTAVTVLLVRSEGSLPVVV